MFALGVCVCVCATLCFIAEYSMCESTDHVSLLVQAYEYSRSERMFDSPVNCNV